MVDLHCLLGNRRVASDSIRHQPEPPTAFRSSELGIPDAGCRSTACRVLPDAESACGTRAHARGACAEVWSATVAVLSRRSVLPAMRPIDYELPRGAEDGAIDNAESPVICGPALRARSPRG